MITNLQLKSKTIQAIAKIVKNSENIDHFNVFIAWANEFRDGSVPADNANVTTAAIPEQLVVMLYESLLGRPYGIVDTAIITDFTTAIQSKRNGDPVFDAQCTAVETKFSGMQASIKSEGKILLVGTVS